MNLRQKTIPIVFAASLLCGTAHGGDSIALQDYTDSLSYVLGRDIGAQLKEIGTPLKIGVFSKALQQALQGQPTMFDSSTTDSIRRQFAEHVREQMGEQQEELANKNKTDSKHFLEANKKEAGVITTASGLQYKVLTKGKGPSPDPTDSVSVYYRGSLIDNTVIDSTIPDQPATLDLSRTIPGLSEGIQLMNIGSKYRFFLPPELAYGSTGAPPAVPPESVLVFDIELVDIPGKKENTGTIY